MAALVKYKTTEIARATIMQRFQIYYYNTQRLCVGLYKYSILQLICA